MEINLNVINQVTVITIAGNLDSSTAPKAEEKILPLARPGCKIALEMSHVPYMSSAGLRMLLLIYRQISGSDGQVVLVGLSEELKDTMAVTGFLDFFQIYPNLESGLATII